jgi:CBS domain-containing membrane protein
MTREVCTVRRNDRLSQAKQRMDEGGFRHLVVLDDDDAPAGVLSARDISFNALAWSMGQGAHSYESSLDRALVKEVMHGETVSIDSAASIRTAAQYMLDRRIGCLPVVDGETLVGIITDADFLKLFPQHD